MRHMIALDGSKVDSSLWINVEDNNERCMSFTVATIPTIKLLYPMNACSIRRPYSRRSGALFGSIKGEAP
eukprot:6260077-Ditylum_brightwellii.AAC.1